MSKVFLKFCAIIALISSPVLGQESPEPTFNPGTGALTVTGTSAPDSIVITVENNIVQVSGFGSGVNADEVTTILVEGLAGNDVIDLSEVLASDFPGISLEAGAITIEGGSGNDRIFGSGLDDTIRGGTGNDFIFGDQREGNRDGFVLGFEEAGPDVVGPVNFDRTKDADIADINNDGALDIYDANSEVGGRSDALVVRINDGMGGFSVTRIEPQNESIFTRTYDSDLADLNGDGYPDLIRTQESEVGVYLNKGAAPWFEVDRENTIENFVDAPGGIPDDIAVGDLDNDGDLDFAVARRGGGAGGVRVYFNNLDSVDANAIFGSADLLSVGPLLHGFSGSTHDVFFADPNRDGYLDIVAVNESGAGSRLFLNDGNTPPTFTLQTELFPVARGGEGVDFNGDGADDFIFGGPTGVSVVLNTNDDDNPGQFFDPQGLDVAGASSIYDIEVGDLDNDGDLDVVGASINRVARIWLNDGTGDFTLFGGTTPLPDLPLDQWLSADLIDFDLDGDNDVYITGGDGQGRVQNRFFFNNLVQYGNDRIEGGPGNDTIFGGSGNDRIYGGTAGGNSIVGDVNVDGRVDFLDISPFIRVLQTGVFQFEADIDGNGVVNFSDISPFIVLLESPVPLEDGDDILMGGAGLDMIVGGAGSDRFFGFRASVGDVNLDGQVNFSDISFFIGVLQSGVFQFEADIDGNGVVNFLDISPFTTLLSGVQSLLRDGAEDEFDDVGPNDNLIDDLE